ncbi:MAG: FHA domain-containing protein [Phycisphaerae bacterium]
MRLVVKKGDKVFNELQFSKGPINIGRHADSQVFLPERVVSRYHAVLYTDQQGQWCIEDLGSSNKTFLNGEPVHKAQIKTDDILLIAEFTIEINLEDETIVAQPINLDDTLTTASDDAAQKNLKDPYEPKTIVRRIDSGKAPDIKLPVKRTISFAQAAESICKARGLEEILKVLLSITTRQFDASHSWGALRNVPTGPMLVHAGRSRDGKSIEFNKLRLKEKISQSIEKHQFLLIPRIPDKAGQQQIHSAIIAPVSCEGGCFGVLYLDNDMAHPCYDMSDLDYLMLLAIHTATVVENF